MSIPAQLSSLFSRRRSILDTPDTPTIATAENMHALYEPSVLLIVAGGTICMQDSASGLVTSKLFLDECLSPQPTFNDGTRCPTSSIVDEHGTTREAPVLRLPRDRNGANVKCTILEFNPLLDSSTAHSPTWNQLARTVKDNETAFDAFVICHGTDTLAYTAAALSFVLMPRLRKTVVLTGAQRSMFFADSDGSDNLLGAIVLASHVRFPEVCVYFGDKLLKGTRITKVSASSYSGFESPNTGPLATVSETGITVHGDSLHTPNSHAAITDADTLPTLDSSAVALLKIYPGLTPALLTIILSSPGLRGAVLETFGAGNVPLPLIPALAEAVTRGLVLVNITQCLHGSVSSAYAPARGLAEAGVVAGGDMTSEAAYAKLVYLLARRDLGMEEVSANMGRDIGGEMTPPEIGAGGEGGKVSVAQLPIRYVRTVGGTGWVGGGGESMRKVWTKEAVKTFQGMGGDRFGEWFVCGHGEKGVGSRLQADEQTRSRQDEWRRDVSGMMYV